MINILEFLQFKRLSDSERDVVDSQVGTKNFRTDLARLKSPGTSKTQRLLDY